MEEPSPSAEAAGDQKNTKAAIVFGCAECALCE